MYHNLLLRLLVLWTSQIVILMSESSTSTVVTLPPTSSAAFSMSSSFTSSTTRVESSYSHSVSAVASDSSTVIAPTSVLVSISQSLDSSVRLQLNKTNATSPTTEPLSEHTYAMYTSKEQTSPILPSSESFDQTKWPTPYTGMDTASHYSSGDTSSSNPILPPQVTQSRGIPSTQSVISTTLDSLRGSHSTSIEPTAGGLVTPTLNVSPSDETSLIVSNSPTNNFTEFTSEIGSSLYTSAVFHDVTSSPELTYNIAKLTTSHTNNTTSPAVITSSDKQGTLDIYTNISAETTELHTSTSESTSWTQNTTDLYSSTAASTYWTQNTTDLYSSKAASTSWTKNTTDLYSSTAESISWTQNTTDLYSSIAASTSWTQNTTDLYSSTAASTSWTQNTTDLYSSTAASTSWTKNTTDLYSSTAASTYWTQNTTDLYSSTAESTSWTRNTTDLYSSTAESTSWTQSTTYLYSSTAASTYWTQNTTDRYSSTAASTSWTKNTTDLYSSTAESTSWTQNTTDMYSSIAASTSWTKNTTDLYSSTAASTSWTQNTTDLYSCIAASTSWTQNTTDLYPSTAASTYWTQNTTDLYSSTAESTSWTKNTTDLYSSTAESTSWTQNTTDLYSSTAASTYWTQNTTDLYSSTAASPSWTKNTTDLYLSTAASTSWTQNTTDLYSSIAASTSWTQNTTDLYSSIAALTSWTQNTTDLYPSTAASTSWTQNTTDLYSSLAASTSWTQNTTDLYSSLAASTYWTQNTTDLYSSTAASTSWTQNTTDLYSSKAASTSWTQNTTDLYPSKAASTYWTQNTTDLYSSTAAFSWSQEASYTTITGSFETQTTYSSTLLPSKTIPLTMTSLHNLTSTTSLRHTTDYFATVPLNDTHITTTTLTFTSYSKNLTYSSMNPSSEIHSTPMTKQYTTEYSSTVIYDDTSPFTPPVSSTEQTSSFTTAQKTGIASTAAPPETTTQGCLTFSHNNGTSYKKEEESNLTLICEFNTSGNCDTIRWKIRSYESDKNTTKITITHNVTRDRSKSKLVIRQLSLNDEGNISCHLGNGNITFDISVQPLPRLDIFPPSSVVENGNRVDLVCNISNADKINITGWKFSWQRNGSNVTTGISRNTSASSLHFTSSSNGIYQCKLCQKRSPEQCQISRNSSVQVYKTAAAKCGAGTDSGIHWEDTPAGFQLEKKCPESNSGTATRKCDTNGKWENTNMIYCVSKEIEEATKTIKDLEGLPDDEKKEKIGGVLDSIKNVTSESNRPKEKAISSGNLRATNEALTSMVNIINNSSIEMDNTTQKNFVGIIDDMLSVENKNSWTEVDDQSDITSNSVPAAGTLLTTVETFGVSVAKSLLPGESVDLVNTNFGINLLVVTEHRKYCQDKERNLEPRNKTEIPKIPRVIKIKNTNGSVIDFKPTDSAKGTSIDFNLDSNKIQNGNVTFTAALYKTMGTLLQNSNSTDVTSEVLALSVPGHNTSYLPSGVILTFDLNNLTNENNFTEGNNKRCVFWNNTQGWDSGGCRWKNGSCNCTHLTNFAVIMSPVKASDAYVLRIISFVGCILSVISTVTTVVVYLKLWRYLKSDGSRLLLNLCTALTFAYVLFLAGIDQTKDSVMCTTMAALLHYFFLSTFCLMLAEGIQLLISVTFVFHATSKLKWLLLVGWGLPLVIVGITIGVTYDNEYKAEDYCWLTLSNGVIYSFVGPAVCIIMINVIVIFHVMKAMFSSKLIATKTEKQKIFAGVRSVMVLLPILGITWLFGIISINNDLLAFQYLFAVTNSLQGFFIFLFYCIFNQPVRKALEKKIKRFESRTQSSRTGSKLQMLKTNSSDSSKLKVTDDEIRLDDFHIPRLRLPPPSMDQRGEDGQQILPSRQYSSSSSWYDNDQYGSRLLKSNPDGKQF